MTLITRLPFFLSDYTVRFILILTAFSALALGLHRAGAMDTSYNLLSNSTISYYEPLLSGDVIGYDYLTKKQDEYEIKCLVLTISEHANCGIRLKMGASKKGDNKAHITGVDLSKYQEVELQISYQGPNADDRLKVSFGQFSPAHSNKGEIATLKYNSINIFADNTLTSLTIPLSSFSVNDEWIKAFKVRFADAQRDFTNIVLFEVALDTINAKGNYYYKIEKVVLHGHLITALQLQKIIFLLWAGAVLYLTSRQADKLTFIAKSDTVTDLNNRRGISHYVNTQLSSLIVKPSYLFYFDLEGFKHVNDTHGHKISDLLLIEFAEKLKSTLNQYESNDSAKCLARLGGDEFIFSITPTYSLKPQLLAEEIVSAFTKPIEISGRLLKVGINLGVAKFEPGVKSFSEILAQADIALHVAKREGKNSYRIYDTEVKESELNRKQIANELSLAIESNKLVLNYMPIVDANTKVIKKVEILLRTTSIALAKVGPHIFIPIAEEFGIIQKVDLWVIEHSFIRIREHFELFEQNQIMVCINISAKQINNVNFVDEFTLMLEKYTIDPSFIELEITETSILEVDKMSIGVLNKLRSLGVKLTLDDFGTGYSAFQHVEHYPIDCLKIDKSFLDAFNSNTETSKATIQAIVAIAKSHKLQTVAEGIETLTQSQFLESIGCDLLQGYYYSKPVQWDVFVERILQGKLP